MRFHFCINRVLSVRAATLQFNGQETMNLHLNLKFFIHLAKSDSIAQAAHAMDLTPSAASKKLTGLESYYGVKLIERTSKHLSLTAEGEIVLEGAQQLLDQAKFIETSINQQKEAAQGRVTISAPFGLGKSFFADIVSAFHQQHENIQITLNLTDKLIRLPDESIDIAIRVGRVPDSRLVAHRLATNEQIICASPTYLETYGEPKTPSDLKHHRIIGLRQYEDPANLWHFGDRDQTTSVKVPLVLETNDGEVAVNWAIKGLGIIRRARWHVEPLIQTGALTALLADYTPSPSNIFALHTTEARKVKRISLVLDFLKQHFNPNDHR